MKSNEKSKNIASVKLTKKHLEMLKVLAEKEGKTQKECMGEIIDMATRQKKTQSKLKAKLDIKEMDSSEAFALLEHKIDSLEKSHSYIVGMIKTQEREILNPILTESRKISGQNLEIITALKNLK